VRLEELVKDAAVSPSDLEVLKTFWDEGNEHNGNAYPRLLHCGSALHARLIA